MSGKRTCTMARPSLVWCNGYHGTFDAVHLTGLTLWEAHSFHGIAVPFAVTWWLIPLSKWVITPVINGISRVNPLITGVITHLLSGMSHQVTIRHIRRKNTFGLALAASKERRHTCLYTQTLTHRRFYTHTLWRCKISWRKMWRCKIS